MIYGTQQRLLLRLPLPAYSLGPCRKYFPLQGTAFYDALLRTKGEERIVPIQSVVAVMGMKPLSESGQTAADSDGDIIAF